MEPGSELDERVATHVMNWPAMHPLSRPLPPYSTDIASAWAVDKSGWLWEFQETEMALTVTLYTSAEVLLESIRNRDFRLPEQTILIRQEWLDDKARTYAWLRCLAALEAVGVEVGGD